MASAQASPRLVADRIRAQKAPALRLAGPRWCWMAAVLACAAAAGAPPLAPPATSRAASGARLNDVRAWSSGEVTRVALEISAEVRFSHGLLANPDRVYVDLHGTRPDSKRGLIYTLPLVEGPIRRVRVALTQPTVTRVVLDLDGVVEYSVSQLANPERVMLEVRRTVLSLPPRAITEITRRTAPPAPEPRFEPRPFVAPVAVSRETPLLIGAVPHVSPRPAWRTNTVAFPVPRAEPPGVAKAVEPAPPRAPSNPGREPLPAQHNRSGNRSLTRVLGLKLNKVVLDPGHGGYDHGSTGHSGVVEKELVLDVANRLGKLIEDRLGAEVVLTRNDDTFVALEDRVRMANELRADLFLSIHANSSPYKSVSGSETYYLSFTSSKADMDVAARENAGAQSSIHELSEVLRKIALQDKAEESREFAAKVQASTYELNARSASSRTRNRGVKKAPFVVLIGAKMPSILTEIGFVTNSREAGLLKTGDYRQKIAEALYKGIYRYADTLSHFSVASRSATASAQ